MFTTDHLEVLPSDVHPTLPSVDVFDIAIGVKVMIIVQGDSIIKVMINNELINLTDGCLVILDLIGPSYSDG